MEIAIILTVNLIVSIIFLAVKNEYSHRIPLLGLFVFMPICGITIFALADSLYRRFDRPEYDKKTLNYRLPQQFVSNQVNMDEQLDIVSISDLKNLASSSEKREVVLNQLKENLTRNYAHIIEMQSDSDSETAHYIAAAKMESYDHFIRNLETARQKYYHDNSTLEDYLDKIRETIDSKLLSSVEQEKYQNLYLQLSQGRFDDNSYKYMYDLKMYDELLEINDIQENETLFLLVLKYHYNNKNKIEFQRQLNKMIVSQLTFSYDALEIIRTYKSRYLNDPA